MRRALAFGSRARTYLLLVGARRRPCRAVRATDAAAVFTSIAAVTLRRLRPVEVRADDVPRAAQLLARPVALDTPRPVPATDKKEFAHVSRLGARREVPRMKECIKSGAGTILGRQGLWRNDLAMLTTAGEATAMVLTSCEAALTRCVLVPLERVPLGAIWILVRSLPRAPQPSGTRRWCVSCGAGKACRVARAFYKLPFDVTLAWCHP